MKRETSKLAAERFRGALQDTFTVALDGEVSSRAASVLSRRLERSVYRP